MFAEPVVNPSSDLRGALSLIPVKARDVRPEHFEQLSSLGTLRPHVKNELRELVALNAWRERRPQRLHAALPLLMELARLKKLTVTEGGHSGCKLPHAWNVRTSDGYGFSVSVRLATEMASRAIILARVGPFLEIDHAASDLAHQISWHVESAARASVDGRPLVDAIAWLNPTLGVVVNHDVLDDLIWRLNKSKKGDHADLGITFL